MEEKKINVIVPLLKADTLSRNGYVIPKDVLEKALEEWKQKGMPSVEIKHMDGFFDDNTKKFKIEWKEK